MCGSATECKHRWTCNGMKTQMDIDNSAQITETQMNSSQTTRTQTELFSNRWNTNWRKAKEHTQMSYYQTANEIKAKHTNEFLSNRKPLKHKWKESKWTHKWVILKTTESKNTRNWAWSAGFEPARAKPTWFLVMPDNHSGTTTEIVIRQKIFESFIMEHINKRCDLQFVMSINSSGQKQYRDSKRGTSNSSCIATRQSLIISCRVIYSPNQADE